VSREAEVVVARWLDYPSAVTYSGLSRSTLWLLIKEGELDAANIGRAVRIDRESIDSYMRRQMAPRTKREASPKPQQVA
jgi:excisionase family DNA binding protein